MPDGGTPQAAVHAEHRHEVERRESDGGHDVDVGAVAVVESRVPHGSCVELLVHPPRVAAPVLVRLDLDEGGFGASRETRDRPRVRVGLPERVDAALHEQLAQLRAIRLPRDEARQARPGGRGGQGEERGGDRVALGRGRLGKRCRGARGRLEGPLELGARGHEVEIPFPLRAERVEGTVGDRVEGEERELEVVVDDGIGRPRGLPGELRQRGGRTTRRARQEIEEGRAQRSAGPERDADARGVQGVRRHLFSICRSARSSEAVDPRGGSW